MPDDSDIIARNYSLAQMFSSRELPGKAETTCSRSIGEKSRLHSKSADSYYNRALAMDRVFNVDQLDVSRLLEQWRWLCGQSVTLVARNGFGDMFLRASDGKILRLDVGGGTLTEIAESELGFEHSLAESAKRELWFAEKQLATFAERGLKPNDLQCIGFKTPVVFAESRSVPDRGGTNSQ